MSEPKTITITVTGSNDAPVAKDATETTEENGTERQRASGHGCGRYGVFTSWLMM
ncbi:Ig-like domain-containing protein [Vibrio lentus]|nr:Ig-like domain-containing protein [Vibrio lentus]